MSDAHTTNLFPLELSASTVDLTCLDIEAPAGLELTPELLGELAFHLGRQLHALVQVRGAGLVMARWHDGPDPIELQVDGDTFLLMPQAPQRVQITNPAWNESIRRLISEELRWKLVAPDTALWHRGASFYEARLSTAHNSDIGWCEGTTLEVVTLSGGRLALAVDRTLARLGRPLGAMQPGDRAKYIAINPYQVPTATPTGEESEDQVQGSQRQRNYVLVRGGEIVRRVYVDVGRTLQEPNDVVYVQRGLSGPSDPVDPLLVRPVLAPGEVADRQLPVNCRPQLPPSERLAWARRFLQRHARALNLLGGPAEVSLDPVDGRALGCQVLAWPSLAVGPHGVEVPPPTSRFAEYRVDALHREGFRHVPEGWGGVMIVPLEGKEDLANILLREVRGWLLGWKFSGDRMVRLSEVALPATGGATQRVQVVHRHLRELPTAARPSALIVFKEDNWGSGDPSQDIYQALHEQLGRQGGFPLKVIQARHYNNWEPVAQIDLLGVLARAGAVPWGLAPGPGQRGLHHNLVFAMDIGGRDRSSRSRSERVGFVAMGGSSIPRFHHSHPDAVREAVPPDLLMNLVLGAAKDLAGTYEGGWIFLRDGRFADEELEALQAAARVAIERRLLDPTCSFTAVEVHKSHALRIFGVERDQIVQPECGTLLWLTSAGPQTGQVAARDALLASTGHPWNLGGGRGGSQATARPIRCIVRNISGPSAHNEAMSDIWRLTHLPWQMPRAPLKLPFPLHCTATLLLDLANGRLPYRVPC